jgi:hypothetical protein
LRVAFARIPSPPAARHLADTSEIRHRPPIILSIGRPAVVSFVGILRTYAIVNFAVWNSVARPFQLFNSIAHLGVCVPPQIRHDWTIDSAAGARAQIRTRSREDRPFLLEGFHPSGTRGFFLGARTIVMS